MRWNFSIWSSNLICRNRRKRIWSRSCGPYKKRCSVLDGDLSRLHTQMTTQLQKVPVSFLIRRSVRYLLVSHGFRLLQVLAILAALSFVLTGSRIAFVDQYGNRADIVASIFVTIATIALLTTLNRRVMTAVDRRFFREAYNAELILTE